MLSFLASHPEFSITHQYMFSNLLSPFVNSVFLSLKLQGAAQPTEGEETASSFPYQLSVPHC
jgi:hypothetical protein